MQNPRVSLPSVGAREVRHGNTRPTTRTARFFPYTNYGKLNWPRTAAQNGGCDRPAVCCTRGGADWPKVVAVGAQQPISGFFGFIQMRDTLSTNGEHLRIAEVKSFPAIPKSMRSVNGDQNGANLKKVVSLAGLHHICLQWWFLHFPCLLSTLPQRKLQDASGIMCSGMFASWMEPSRRTALTSGHTLLAVL